MSGNIDPQPNDLTVVYYDEILVVNLTFLITKNVDLNLIR